MVPALDQKKELDMEQRKIMPAPGLVTVVKEERQTPEKVGLHTILFTVHVCLGAEVAMGKESVVLAEDPLFWIVGKRLQINGFSLQKGQMEQEQTLVVEVEAAS